MNRFFALVLILLPGHAFAQNTPDTLSHIAETGEITIGYRAAEPPMSFADAEGLPKGYSVEICRRIATDVGETLGRTDIQTNFVAVTAETRFRALEDGTIDILCGATTKTLSRAERVGFTQLTFVTGGALLSLDQSRVGGLADAGGRRIAVTENTTTIDALREAGRRFEIDFEIVPVASADAGLTALIDGSVDALAADQVVLIGKVLSQVDTEQDYFITGDLFSFEPFALGIPRGDADFALVANRTISRLFRTAQILPIYREYFRAFGEQPPSALAALWELMATPE